jgi:phosphonate transport system substrate-binding protein
MMPKLLFGSCQAPNADDFMRDVFRFVQQSVEIEIEFVDRMTWQEREAALDRGEIQLAWICGLPYVQKADARPAGVKLLAAPVLAGSRYEGRPVYFSDVIVRSASDFWQFTDLRNAVWGYNEPNSHSGYNLVRYELARRGLDGSFFSRVIQSGSHQQAIEAILTGTIDAVAVDSTVLETELLLRPPLAAELRVIETFGPSPIPPLVASTLLQKETVDSIREALLTMHRSRVGRPLLERHQAVRFAAVDDDDYDPIREMTKIAEVINL